jgi:hypothetical protein
MSTNGTNKRPAIDDDSQEQEELERDRARKASRVEDDDSPRKDKPAIYPMTPTLDPLATDGNGPNMDQYVIYMCSVEEPSSVFTAGIQKCAATCSTEIQKACFQQDGTRHISMWDGMLTHDQARRLQFRQPMLVVPIKIELMNGWNNWTAGNYLQVGGGSTAALQQLLEDLEGLPKGKKGSCNHLSLYRKRGADKKKAKEQFEKVRKALANHRWGSLQGVSVRIKLVGTPYEECRVLAGV